MIIHCRPVQGVWGSKPTMKLEMPDHFKSTCESVFGPFPIVLTSSDLKKVDTILGLNEGGVEWVWIEGLIAQNGSIRLSI